MTEDQLENLLQKADQTAPAPQLLCRRLTAAVRRRAERRHLANSTAPFVAAAVVLIALGLWALATRTTETTHDQNKIASLETQLTQLQARTDATLKLIHEVLEYERRQHRLDELQAQLANIPDPLEEVQKQVDRTAFILVYQADRMYRQLNQKDSAVQAYNRVIELFPQNQWADVARQRLSQIHNNSVNKKVLKGDLL